MYIQITLHMKRSSYTTYETHTRGSERTKKQTSITNKAPASVDEPPVGGQPFGALAPHSVVPTRRKVGRPRATKQLVVV